MSTPYYDEYVEEQKEIAAQVLDSLPPVGSVNTTTIRETVKSNEGLSQALERSMEKALVKAHKDESQNRPMEILENAENLIESVTFDMFDGSTEDDIENVRLKIKDIFKSLNKLSDYLGEN